jgi:tetratricopeptide (TPR) repeat protein
MIGDYSKAIEALTKSAVLSEPDRPHTPKTYSLLSMAFVSSGQHEAAWSVCRNGRRLVPDNAELLFLEGELLQHFQKFSDAESAFLALLAQSQQSYLAGFDPSIHGFRARHQLAVVLARQDRYDEAETHWRRVIEEAPGFTPAWQGLLDLLLLRGKTKLIRELTDRMIDLPETRGLAHLWRSRLAETKDLQPENFNITMNLGAICFSQHRYEEANRWLEQALEHNPQSAEAYLYQGETLHQLGRTAEAQHCWNEAARLAVDENTKQQALGRLRDVSQPDV